jgi:hypothetical protein
MIMQKVSLITEVVVYLAHIGYDIHGPRFFRQRKVGDTLSDHERKCSLSSCRPSFGDLCLNF